MSTSPRLWIGISENGNALGVASCLAWGDGFINPFNIAAKFFPARDDQVSPETPVHHSEFFSHQASELLKVNGLVPGEGKTFHGRPKSEIIRGDSTGRNPTAELCHVRASMGRNRSEELLHPVERRHREFSNMG